MKDRIEHIDGLRGVAVLAVVLFHAGVHNIAFASTVPAFIALFLRQGCHGVDLFFVLSGFCLAYPTLATVHSRTRADFSICSYSARRLIRIIPPYYAAIALFSAIGLALTTLHVPLPDFLPRDALSAAAIAKQMLFLDAKGQFVDASFWTLAIEFRWYFIFPVLLLVFVRSPKAFAALALIVFLSGSTRIYSFDLFFLPLFMLGIVAAVIYVKRHTIARWALPALVLSLVLAVLSTHDSGWYFYDKGPFWGIAAFWLVVLAGASVRVRRLLSYKWIVSVGSASYGVYLVHEPVVAFVERWAVPEIGSLYAFGIGVCAAVVTGLCFSLAVEKRFVSSTMRKWLLGRLESALPQIFTRVGVPASICIEAKRDASSRSPRDVVHPVEIAV